MKGFDALGEHLTGGIASVADKNFAFTEYSLETLIPACQRMTSILFRCRHRAPPTNSNKLIDGCLAVRNRAVPAAGTPLACRALLLADEDYSVRFSYLDFDGGKALAAWREKA